MSDHGDGSVLGMRRPWVDCYDLSDTTALNILLESTRLKIQTYT